MSGAGIGPVGIVPPGMLGLLGLKTLGRNPRDLGSTYDATLEVMDWIAQQNALVATVSAGLTASPFVQAANVPEGEYWYIHGLTLSVETGGDPLQTAYCGIQFDPVLAPRRVLAKGVPYVTNGVTPDRFCAYADQPFFAPPGSSLGYVCSGAVTAATAIFVTRYTILPN